MEIGLILQVLKLSLEVFKEERGDLYHRLLKKRNELEKEWHEEMSLPDDKRSDLAIDRILLESNQLAALIVAEHSKK
jgi:hypothetical protein